MTRIFFCILCYAVFSITCLCSAKEVTLEELIHGVNLTRNRIRNGEVRAIVTTNYSAEKSPEEIQAWMKEEREYILDAFSSDGKAELERQLRTIPFMVERYGGYQTIEESNFMFQIFDKDFADVPETFQYKMTRLDRSKIDLYSEKAAFFWSGSFEVLTYDGSTEAIETIEAVAPLHSFALFDSHKNAGFLHFELYGSTYRVPANARLVGQETIGSADCYILEFNHPKRDELVKIWVDAEKDFCIRQVHLRRSNQSYVWWESIYEDFQKFEGIWYPKVVRFRHNTADGAPHKIRTIHIKEAQFNIDLPVDLFHVDRKFYFRQPRLRIAPFSEIISPEFGPIEKK